MGTVLLSDREALDRLAAFMGAQESWNGGDVCEVAAELIAATGRPPVGDQSFEVLTTYRVLADAYGYAHDGPEDGQYAAADADHAPVADPRGDHYECNRCGLATLADGSRHGHLED